MNNHNHYRPYERLREEDLYQCTDCEGLKQQLSDQQALIEKQAKVIEILKESNDFYADKYNWDDDNIDNIDTELRKEIYQEKVLIFYEGGKKARLAQKQVEEIDDI